MSSMDDLKAMSLQAKLFDFALVELVIKHRESFEPLWTVDSWVKFLIWVALNCGLSGEKESLEFFAESVGAPLANRMRKLFFERTLESLQLKILADPAESNIFALPTDGRNSVTFEEISEALKKIDLKKHALSDQSSWQFLEAMVLIPWRNACFEN